ARQAVESRAGRARATQSLPRPVQPAPVHRVDLPRHLRPRCARRPTRQTPPPTPPPPRPGPGAARAADRNDHDRRPATRGRRPGAGGALGISMLLSSGRSQCWLGRFLVDGAVAKHRPEGGDASPCEGDERLLVVLAFGAFAVIERWRRGTVLQARERGEVAGPHQPPIEPSRAVVVAADPAGVTWCRGETGAAGQPIDGLERS